MLLLNFGEYDWIVTKEALVEDRKHCKIGHELAFVKDAECFCVIFEATNQKEEDFFDWLLR